MSRTVFRGFHPVTAGMRPKFGDMRISQPGMESQQDQFRVQTVTFVQREFCALISAPGFGDAVAVSELLMLERM
ncbi:hypothetical protein [Roseinatronobacter thiooxidans]|uniref:hypothetical protein n=1 Tax=Roseinatronobacter thiooxidans TaxID=121821 RepID=UPI0008F8B196|nr:hypothetical protein [Roseinatronobacter thiooxidans]